jgi:hypothetical protein
MSDDLLYEERVSSKRSAALFWALAGVFCLLSLWRFRAGGWGLLGGVFLFFAAMFLFYALNYRALIIRVTPEALTLRFGVFSWRVALDNIVEAALDELPPMLDYGGAGIHFMMVRGRYRVSFNFLEYPMAVIALRRRSGPVRDVSFSTRRPEELLRLIKTGGQDGRAG